MLKMRLLCAAILTATIAGCAHSPGERAFLWWPQGPGNTSGDLPRIADSGQSHDASRTPFVETPHSSCAPGAGSESEAVRHGDLLYVSGQIGDRAGSGIVVGNNIDAQARSAMDKVMRILERHGLTDTNIVFVTIYLRELDDLRQADAVYASYFRRSPPPRAVVGVNTLPGGSLIEIAVVAGD